MDGEFRAEDDEPFSAWLPPEDRLWRHPSEAARNPTSGSGGARKPNPSTRSIGGFRAPENFSVRAVWTLVLVAGAVGAITASGVGIMTGAWDHRTTLIRPVINSSPTITTSAGVATTADWTRVNDEIAPSVVSISVKTASGPVIASGLLLFDGGAGEAYLVTDRSTFTAGSGNIEVTSAAGSQARARLVGQDTQSDIAVLAVSDRVPWIFAPIGTIATVRQASPAITVGSPSAPGGSIATGMVAATDREVSLSNGADLDHLIQLATPSDASPGAGAAAVDANGQVIGVTVQLQGIDEQDQGYTFAVPIDEVVQAARQIVEGHDVVHPWLGLDQTVDLPSAVAHQKGITGGVAVYGVAASSPAAKIGLSSSDIILSFDGEQVDSSGALEAILDRSQVNRAIAITYLHQSRTVTTHVVLVNEPPGA